MNFALLHFLRTHPDYTDQSLALHLSAWVAVSGEIPERGEFKIWFRHSETGRSTWLKGIRRINRKMDGRPNRSAGEELTGPPRGGGGGDGGCFPRLGT